MTDLLAPILRHCGLNANDDDDVKVLDDRMMEQVRFFCK